MNLKKGATFQNFVLYIFPATLLTKAAVNVGYYMNLLLDPAKVLSLPPVWSDSRRIRRHNASWCALAAFNAVRTRFDRSYRSLPGDAEKISTGYTRPDEDDELLDLTYGQTEGLKGGAATTTRRQTFTQ